MYGRKRNLYHSERHMIDIIGDKLGIKIREFAATAGVTRRTRKGRLIKKRNQEAGNGSGLLGEFLLSISKSGLSGLMEWIEEE